MARQGQLRARHVRDGGQSAAQAADAGTERGELDGAERGVGRITRDKQNRTSVELVFDSE